MFAIWLCNDCILAINRSVKPPVSAKELLEFVTRIDIVPRKLELYSRTYKLPSKNETNEQALVMSEEPAVINSKELFRKLYPNLRSMKGTHKLPRTPTEKAKMSYGRRRANKKKGICRHWITNGVDEKLIHVPAEQWDSYECPVGWYRGRSNALKEAFHTKVVGNPNWGMGGKTNAGPLASANVRRKRALEKKVKKDE